MPTWRASQQPGRGHPERALRPVRDSLDLQYTLHASAGAQASSLFIGATAASHGIPSGTCTLQGVRACEGVLPCCALPLSSDAIASASAQACRCMQHTSEGQRAVSGSSGCHWVRALFGVSGHRQEMGHSNRFF